VSIYTTRCCNKLF